MGTGLMMISPSSLYTCSHCFAAKRGGLVKVTQLVMNFIFYPRINGSVNLLLKSIV